MTKRIKALQEVASNTEKISAAPITYIERSKKLLVKGHVDSMLKDVAEIEKRINIKVRNELKALTEKGRVPQ